MKVWATGILLAGLLAGCGKKEEEEEPVRERAGGGGATGWISLVPGKGNGAWKVAEFGSGGEAGWQGGVMTMTMGADLTGMRWDGELPTPPYEVRLEARKTLGDDFFCGLTVPVRGPEECVTFIVGGWGGGTVGISSIGGLDASENETSSYRVFDTYKWYKIRMVVREDRLEGWIDDEQVLAADIKGREIGLRPGMIELTAPFGMASFQVEAEVRGMEWRKLE